MEVDGFTKAFGFPLPEGDFDTLGGYLSSLAGHLPDVGERFTYNGWQFVVAAKEGARIDRVRVSRLKGARDGKDKDGKEPRDGAPRDGTGKEPARPTEPASAKGTGP
jgi:Mg2+/Co2+ transporter CorC